MARGYEEKEGVYFGDDFPVVRRTYSSGTYNRHDHNDLHLAADMQAATENKMVYSEFSAAVFVSIEKK